MTNVEKALGRKVKMYMGIPSMGDRSDFQFLTLRLLQERYKDYVEFVYPSDCVYRIFHDHARNAIVRDFLETDCDVLWFLDADIGPSKHVLDLIVNHWDKWQAAGAAYPIWATQAGQQYPQILFTAYKGTGESEFGTTGIRMCEVLTEGQEFVDGLATGCMFLKRSVFDNLQKPYFEFKYEADTRNIIEGEDIGFCLKLMKQGVRFFTDYSLVCKHYKRVDLLDMNNYTVDFAKERVRAYDAEIRPQIQAALDGIYAQGKIDAAKELRDKVSVHKQFSVEVEGPALAPRRTASGLILPR